VSQQEGASPPVETWRCCQKRRNKTIIQLGSDLDKERTTIRSVERIYYIRTATAAERPRPGLARRRLDHT